MPTSAILLNSFLSSGGFTLRHSPLLSSANPIPISSKQRSIPTPSQSKLTKRKNHLRPKLLKTLKTPSTNPIIPTDSSPPPAPLPSLDLELNDSQYNDASISQTSNSIVVTDDNFSNSSTRTVFKYGLYFVGAFVFQTIVAVWILGSSDSQNKHSKLELDNGSKVLESGGIVHVDESELDGKIAEIRVMAKEAREKEILKSNGSGDNDASVVKTGIEKEVDRRLVMLRKRLGKSVNKVQWGKDGKVEDKEDLDVENGDEKLMFKKKFKFKSLSSNPSHKPKGFLGSEGRSVVKLKNISSLSEDEMSRSGSIRNKDVELLGSDLRSGDSRGGAPMSLEKDGGEKAPSEEEEAKFTRATRDKMRKERGATRRGKETRVGKTNPRIGNSVASSYEKSPSRAVNLEDSTKKEGDLLSRNGSLTGNKAAGNKKSDTHTDLWWLSLSYVLVILMRRGRDGEGPQGLFTLKSTSYLTNGTSYTVAFEDRGDATNFCYILQSFFEDLDDFSADIIPLSTKELEQAVKSRSKKVIVVKKGQLQLYAGQPLPDVEMALFSLVGQS